MAAGRVFFMLLNDEFCLFQGARVWIRHPDKVWEGAEVIQDYKGGRITVKTEDEAVSCMRTGELL